MEQMMVEYKMRRALDWREHRKCKNNLEDETLRAHTSLAQIR